MHISINFNGCGTIPCQAFVLEAIVWFQMRSISSKLCKIIIKAFARPVVLFFIYIYNDNDGEWFSIHS